MKTIRTMLRNAVHLRGDRGSAMLIAMLIMVVLSLIGISFLVLSDTENKIAVNERDDAQVLYVAEAGVEIAKAWFNQPNPTYNSIVPDETNEVDLCKRKGHSDYDQTGAYTIDSTACNGGDEYEGGDAYSVRRLFDKPYRHDEIETFWGEPEWPDVQICDPDYLPSSECNGTRVSNGSYLDKLNAAFNAGNERSLGEVKIIDIRVFRPPVAWDRSLRLGVATIEVTAAKFRKGQLVSMRRVRDVIQEIPYPGPRGAIESAGVIRLRGSMTPHWGWVESELDTYPKWERVYGALPRQAKADLGYRDYADFSPRPLEDDFQAGNIEKNSNLSVRTTTKPCEDSNPGSCPYGNCTTFSRELVGDTKNIANVAGLEHWLEDPWVVYRTQGLFEGGKKTPDVMQPWPTNLEEFVDGTNNPYKIDSKDKGDTGCATGEQGDWSHMLQNQTVKFPLIHYPSMKKAALAGGDAIYYYSYAGQGQGGQPLFQRNGRGDSRLFREWVNTEMDGAGETWHNVPFTARPGFHFFDSLNGLDPQERDDNLNPPGVLTPEVRIAGKAGARDFLMEGFIYLNSEMIEQQGVDEVDLWAQMPGEPFLDIGIDLNHDGVVTREFCAELENPDVKKCCKESSTDTNHQTMCMEFDTYNNGLWDVELDDCNPASTVCESEEKKYLTHSNWNDPVGDPNDFVAQHAYALGDVPHDQDSDGLADVAPMFLKPADADSDMPWPHEPFLNFRYAHHLGHKNGPNQGGLGNKTNSGYEVLVDYDQSDGSSNYKRPIALPDPGCRPYGYRVEAGACDSAALDTLTDASRSTNGYDYAGSYIKLPLNLYGVLYNEGEYDAQGNFVGFGSLLMRQGFLGAGTVDMYFDESLVRDQWPPERWQLPRVFSSSRATESDEGLWSY